MPDPRKHVASLIGFESRDAARRQAVDRPADLQAVLAGGWPPCSRDELATLTRTLRRGRLAEGNPVAGYFANRVARALKALQQRMARYGKTTSWARTGPNGIEVRFPLNDQSSLEFKKLVDGHDRLYGTALIGFVTGRLGPGDVFVDVGANVGYISGFASTTGAAVFALEIQRDLLPLIEQMATINGFDLLRVLHVGGSARSGLSMMPRFEGNPATQLDGQTTRFTRNEPHSVVDDFVPMLALDDAFLDPQLLPKLVKIAVEGHEIGVLEGARGIIEAGRTTFVVEFHPDLVALYRRTAEDLLALFDPAGWSISQLGDDGLRPIAGVGDIRPDPRDPNPKLVFEPRGR